MYIYIYIYIVFFLRRINYFHFLNYAQFKIIKIMIILYLSNIVLDPVPEDWRCL